MASPTRPPRRQRGPDRAWIEDFVKAALTEEESEAAGASETRASPTFFSVPAEWRVDTRRRLAFDIYLTLGHTSLKIFARGPFDEFAFFQRAEVSAGHQFEFLTFLQAGDAETEGYKGYGVFRLDRRSATRLPDLTSDPEFWSALRGYKLGAVPGARVLIRQKFGAYKPTHESAEAGRNAVDLQACDGLFHRTRQPSLEYRDLIEIMRKGLSPVHRITWLEGAMRRPRRGEILQRYYLDADLHAYLVRDHWELGRRLYQLQATREAESKRLICE